MTFIQYKTLISIQYLKMAKEKECLNDQIPQMKWDSSQQHDKSKQRHKLKKLSWRTYPQGEQKTSIGLIAAANSLHLLHILAAYILLSQSNTPTSIEFKENLTKTLHLEFIILWFSITVKFVVFLTIYLDFRICRGDDIHNLLLRLTNYLRSGLRVMVETDLFTSSFFLITLTPISCINFVLSAVIVVFSIWVLQNYSTKKDPFMVGSILFNAILRAKIILSSIIGFLCLKFEQYQISVVLYLTVHVIIAIIVVYAYFQQGFIIYCNLTLRWGIFLSLSAYLSLSMSMIIGTIYHLDPFTFATYFILVTFTVSFYLYFKMMNKKAEIVNLSANMWLQALQIMQILDYSSFDQEKEALVNGFLEIHTIVGCHNPACQVFFDESNVQQQLYTADSNKDQKGSYVKRLIKCKYQQYLIDFPNDYNTLLNYAEFLYQQLNNIAACIFYLNKIKSNKIKLSWTNKLKLDRLLGTIQQENTYFCQHAYEKNVQIQELIKAQETNQIISDKTFQILEQRLYIWELFENQQINLSQISDKMKKIMNDLQQISKQWKSLSHYIQRSQKWRFQYICFILFLKNEKLKSKTIEDLTKNSLIQQQIRLKSDTAINSIAASLFNPDSCCIHTEIKKGNAFVKKVSKNFENLTGYTNIQIENANLNILMPAQIAQKHTKMLIKLSQEGYFSNENNYTIKQVNIINKKGFIVPVLKMYKELVTMQGELQYVCFFKKIKLNDNMLLCDDNFNIIGITQQLSDIISQQGNNGYDIKGVNLLSLVPCLAKSTKFKDIIDQKDYLFSSQAYQARQQHVLELNNIPSNIQHALDTQLKLIYPISSLSRYSLSDQLCGNIQTENIEGFVKCIVQATENIMNNQHQIFNCLFSFKHIHNNHGIQYFQVKIRKIYQRPMSKKREQSKEIQEPLFFKESEDYKQLGEYNDNGIDTASISAKTNIYLKQDTNEAPESNVCLRYLKYLWFGLFIQFIAIIIVENSLSHRQFNSMAVSINNIYQSGQVSITSSRLINLYIAKLLNITTISSITETTQQLQNFINNPLMHQAFFDKAINPSSIFYASSDFAQNSSGYNEIDFLFFIESSFQTLTEPQQITVNSSLYNLIMDYQYPSLNDYLNRTNINLSIEFNIYEKNLQIQLTITFTLQLVIILVSAVLIRTFSVKFYNSMFEMVKIHCRFARSDIDKNLKYLRKIIVVFEDIEYSEYASTSSLQLATKTNHSAKLSLINNKIPQNSNLNKKSKKIILGKTLQRKKKLYYVKVISCFVVLICLCISRNFYLIQLKSSARLQQIVGQNFFNFVPSQYLSAQIMASAYSADAVPAYFPDQYLPLLSNLYIQMNTPYISSPQADAFLQLNKQFTFGDACTISVESLAANNITLQECYSTANHSLRGGLQQYSRYQYEIVKKFFNSSDDISFLQLSQFFRSIDIYHTINDFMAQAWADNYVILTADILAEIDRATLLCLCVILLMIALYKIFLFDYMNEEYELYSFFYANMMPQEVVSGEKIIRSQLKEIHFL